MTFSRGLEIAVVKEFSLLRNVRELWEMFSQGEPVGACPGEPTELAQASGKPTGGGSIAPPLKKLSKKPLNPMQLL